MSKSKIYDQTHIHSYKESESKRVGEGKRQKLPTVGSYKSIEYTFLLLHSLTSL